MFLLRLGLRNLMRNLRRTLLSMGAIITGTALLILGQGFIAGLNENIIRAQTDTLSGHLTARPKGYPTERSQQPIDHRIALDATNRAWLDGHSQAWTQRTPFSVTLSNGRDGVRAGGLVFDPQRDEAVFPRHTWRVEGVVPATATEGVLLGSGPAQLLDLKVGDPVILQARTAKGAINALQVPVAGVFTTANPMIDLNGVFLPEPLGQELLRLDGESTMVHLRLRDRDDAIPLGPQLAEALGDDVEVLTWDDETRDLIALQQIRQKALNLLVFALLGMSATSIANTILMAAYERVREIGTLRAMGMTRSGVVGLFVWEGALMGLIGGLIGASLGGGAVYYWEINPIDLTAMLNSKGANGTFPVSTMLYLAFNPALTAGAVAFAVVVATLASVYPAMVASGMVPAEAVRAD